MEIEFTRKTELRRALHWLGKAFRRGASWPERRWRAQCAWMTFRYGVIG